MQNCTYTKRWFQIVRSQKHGQIHKMQLYDTHIFFLKKSVKLLHPKIKNHFIYYNKNLINNEIDSITDTKF